MKEGETKGGPRQSHVEGKLRVYKYQHTLCFISREAGLNLLGGLSYRIMALDRKREEANHSVL